MRVHLIVTFVTPEYVFRHTWTDAARAVAGNAPTAQHTAAIRTTAAST
jgi:hypothetical protein